MALHPEKRRLWTSRLGWLLVFWLGGMAGLAIVAYLLRIFMNWAGFNS